MFKLENNAKGINQWSKSAKLLIEDKNVQRVSFYSGAIDTSYTVDTLDGLDGNKFCYIPEELLQYDYDITAKAQINDYEGSYSISVISANKPEDYVVKPTRESRYKSNTALFNHMLEDDKLTAPNLSFFDASQDGRPYVVLNGKDYSKTAYTKVAELTGRIDAEVQYPAVLNAGFIPCVELVYNDQKIINMLNDKTVLSGAGGVNWEAKPLLNSFVYVSNIATLDQKYKDAGINAKGLWFKPGFLIVERMVFTWLTVRNPLNRAFIEKCMLNENDIDASLTVKGKPADAKAVGDRLKALEEKVKTL